MRVRNLRFSLDPSKGRTEPLSSGAQRRSKLEERTEETTTPPSQGNKRRKGSKNTPLENMPRELRQRRAGRDEPSMAQLVDPLMGDVVDERSLRVILHGA